MSVGSSITENDFLAYFEKCHALLEAVEVALFLRADAFVVPACVGIYLRRAY